jgi:hypothetical protein
MWYDAKDTCWPPLKVGKKKIANTSTLTISSGTDPIVEWLNKLCSHPVMIAAHKVLSEHYEEKQQGTEQADLHIKGSQS